MIYLLLVLGALVLYALFALRRYFSGGSVKVGPYPPDTVVLRQISRGPYAPSISPFCVKLETYLRMANIKYQNVLSRERSPKGKFPWIQYNGQAVADSQLSVEFLNKKFDVNLNQGLSASDQSIARAFQKMVDENLYWCIVLYRWVYRVNETWLDEAGVPSLLRWYVSRFAGKQTYSHGIGRHNREEVDTIMEGDLRALSDFLGSKNFMMGNEPTEVDCSVFGQLSQFKWNMHGSFANKLVTDTFPNLSAYCERMKSRFWPDWEECITKGKPKSALS